MGKIMEMRRFLTLEGRLTGPAGKTLQKLQQQGNPWGFSESDRAKWVSEVEGLNVLGEDGVEDATEFDFVYWMGCYGGYDPRGQNIAKSVVSLLTQAEAVTDVVNAQTEEGLKQAELQLEGVLSERIGQYKDNIVDILAEIEAQVDFPEEDIDPIIKDRLIKQTNQLIADIKTLLNSYDEGRIIKYGVNTAIVGKPNVGKSSLLNQLIKKERAIVSPQPGTTRDFIEESIDVRGIALKLTDTAGIRATEDEIENIGVELAKKKAQEAELIIAVIDASSELNSDDIGILERIKDTKAVLALNKSDIEPKTAENDLESYIDRRNIVKTSAKHGTGIEELKDTIQKLLVQDRNRSEGSEIVLTELRHKLALESSTERLKSFLMAIKRNESPEFLALDLRVALDSLGEITGEVTTEDILGRIFSKFCIGK